MASVATSKLQLNLPRAWPLLTVPLPLLTWLYLMPALQHTPAAQIPDLTLRLAALLTVPLPALVLHVLTTPPQLATRLLLGEPAQQTVRASLRLVLLATALLLTVPATLALAADLRHVAAVLAGVVPLTAGLAVAAMLHGLRLMARGRHAGWAAVAGGGAFGPAESAPLLYLPAFALVGALAPVALLAAVWNARPEWLTPTIWRGMPLIGLWLGWRLAATALRRARRHLHAGLRAAAQAYATRFAQADGLEEPPRWLTLGAASGALQLLARAWHRRWPLSGIATVALAVGVTVLVPAEAPPLTHFVLAVGFAWIAHSRVLALAHEPVWPASRWLGVTRAVRAAAQRRLACGLSLPLVALAAVLAWQRQGAGLLGLGAGLAVGWSWLHVDWSKPAWIQWGAWLVFGAGVVAGIVGAT